jgi:outer membrane protein OmpA-like peptidoglycan-associated protein
MKKIVGLAVALGSLLNAQQPDLTQSNLAKLEQAVQEQPSALTHMRLAEGFAAVQRWPDARKQYAAGYELALEGKHKEIAAAFSCRIGQVFLSEGKPIEALKAMQRGQSLHPDAECDAEIRKLQIAASSRVLTAAEIQRNFEASRDLDLGPSVDLYINFEFNRDQLTAKGAAQARELGIALADRAYSSRRFEIVGHTDNQGPASVNLPLSKRRAETVKGFIEKEYKITPQRMDTKGMGQTQLLRTGTTEEDHAINRRVQIRLL